MIREFRDKITNFQYLGRIKSTSDVKLIRETVAVAACSTDLFCQLSLNIISKLDQNEKNENVSRRVKALKK